MENPRQTVDQLFIMVSGEFLGKLWLHCPRQEIRLLICTIQDEQPCSLNVLNVEGSSSTTSHVRRPSPPNGREQTRAGRLEPHHDQPSIGEWPHHRLWFLDSGFQAHIGFRFGSGLGVCLRTPCCTTHVPTIGTLRRLSTLNTSSRKGAEMFTLFQL